MRVSSAKRTVEVLQGVAGDRTLWGPCLGLTFCWKGCPGTGIRGVGAGGLAIWPGHVPFVWGPSPRQGCCAEWGSDHWPPASGSAPPPTPAPLSPAEALLDPSQSGDEDGLPQGTWLRGRWRGSFLSGRHYSRAAPAPKGSSVTHLLRTLCLALATSPADSLSAAPGPAQPRPAAALPG